MTNAAMDPERKEWRPNRIIAISHRSFMCDMLASCTCHILLRRFSSCPEDEMMTLVCMHMLDSVGVSAFLQADIINMLIHVSVMMCCRKKHH